MKTKKDECQNQFLFVDIVGVLGTIIFIISLSCYLLMKLMSSMNIYTNLEVQGFFSGWAVIGFIIMMIVGFFAACHKNEKGEWVTPLK